VLNSRVEEASSEEAVVPNPNREGREKKTRSHSGLTFQNKPTREEEGDYNDEGHEGCERMQKRRQRKQDDEYGDQRSLMPSLVEE